MERALIIRQPHIGKILDGIKTWEMRSTETKVRGRIGLIEAGSGLIVGEAILEGVGDPLHDEHSAAITFQHHQVEDFERLKKWRFPWVLSNAKRYENPIPYDHPKGAVIWVKR